jgi:signal transduction histidine kinase/CheY-like chemotaxis protein
MIGGIALGYMLAGILNITAARTGYQLVFWLPGGIMLAAFLIRQPREWASLAAAAIGIDVVLGLATGSDMPAALLFAFRNTAEALAAASLLLWAVRPWPGLESPRAVVAFGSATLLIAMLGASASLLLSGAGGFALPWGSEPFASFVSRTLGYLIVTPALLSLAAMPWNVWSRPAKIGACVLSAVIAGIALAALPGQLNQQVLIIAIMALPVLVLVTAATSLAGGSLAVLAMAVVASEIAVPGVETGERLAMASQWGSVVIYLATAQVLVLIVAAQVAQRAQLAEQLQAAKEAAQAAHRAKLDFLGVMGHELRTPIAAVLGMTDLLDESDLPAREKDYLETIRTSGQHLLAVINDVLDYARGETGRLRLSPVSFSIVELMEQIKAFMAPQAAERALELRVELDASLPPVVSGDPRRLRQVLLNLMSNALKFTHRGSVEVSVRHTLLAPNVNRVRFEVRDTGIGLTQEKARSLFQAFDLHDASTTRRYGGIGLGLAISRRLVDAMDGAMGLESQPGKGSLFWFEVTLPTAAASKQVKLDLSEMPPQKVLVVDDSAVNRRVILQMLRRHGHEVTSARDGLEAVELVVRGRFDLILMDVQMPVMDGLEATRLIRDLKFPQGRTPIVALTASIMPDEYQRCIDAGMDQVLAKPVEWPQLFAVMMSYQEDNSTRALVEEPPQ